MKKLMMKNYEVRKIKQRIIELKKEMIRLQEKLLNE